MTTRATAESGERFAELPAAPGEITDPCPVPHSLVVTTPSSRTPALRHFDEADEPVLAHRIEEPSNIGVQNVVHLPAVNPDMERIQRIVLAAARAGT